MVRTAFFCRRHEVSRFVDACIRFAYETWRARKKRTFALFRKAWPRRRGACERPAPATVPPGLHVICAGQAGPKGVPAAGGAKREEACTSRSSIRCPIRWGLVDLRRLPLLTLFVLLGGVRVKAQWASLISLGVALVVAIAVYWMPFGQAHRRGAEGAAFGFFPIMWIVINALWIFNMTEETGHFAVLRRAFTSVSRRPAHPGGHHRLLLRRPARGARRLRYAGGDLRRDARRPWLAPDQGRGRGPGRRHRAGRLRRDRDPDHHAGPGHRPAQARPQPDGRAPDAAPGAAGAFILGPWSTGGAAARQAGPPRWSPAACSPSCSSRPPTTSPPS